MRRTLLLFFILLLPSCDSAPTPAPTSSRWFVQNAITIDGRCCGLNLLVTHSASSLSGTGTIYLPTSNPIQGRTLSATLTGTVSGKSYAAQIRTIDGSLSFSGDLDEDRIPGTITGLGFDNPITVILDP